MRWRLVLFTCALLAAKQLHPAAAQESTEYWNQFRGPAGDGVSMALDVPVQFDEAVNVCWKTEIPDSGWSSPVVWENEIWLTTGNDKTGELRAICVDLETGSITRNIRVFDMIARRVDPAYKHDSPHLNSPATPTPVVEADRVYVSFGSQGIACLDRKTGTSVWERRDLRVYQPVRQGSSPIVDDQNLYVAFDGTDQQFFVALDKATGATRWRTNRNVDTKAIPASVGKPNDNKKAFATATLIEVNGTRQLIAPAAEATIAYDPETGNEIWRVLHPGGFNVAARPVFANGLVYVFTSGLSHSLLAIRPDGRGDVTETHVAWSTTKSTPSIPSPVIVNDLLFMVTDQGGIARCLKATTGDEIWRMRLGGNHWASPVLVAGKLYFSSKEGQVTVLPATRQQPQIVARNVMRGRFIASPAVAGNSLLLRSTTHLYCLSNGYQRSAEEVAREMQQSPRMLSKAPTKTGASDDSVDWDAAYEKLLESDSAVRRKVDAGNATKEQIIAWLKNKKGDGKKVSKPAGAAKDRGKGDNQQGSVNFYAVVIGRLKSRDIELGEFTFEVDHVSSMYGNRWVKDEIVGKTLRVTGVAGQFLDNLLQIRRGETLRVRTGSYLPDKKTLTFGPKFHVLERTVPYEPGAFGVPADEVRGFRGKLTGRVVESEGYEVLLQISSFESSDGSQATMPDRLTGQRIRVVGFYNQHREFFDNLHEDDTIQVSVEHSDPARDEFTVTDIAEQHGD